MSTSQKTNILWITHQQVGSDKKMLTFDQIDPCIQDFIENIVDVKANGNCGYHIIFTLLGMGEDSWSLVCNHLLKELEQMV